MHGRFWLSQFIVLFKVLDKVYENKNESIAEILKNKKTSELYTTLIDIQDVGDKLAAWAITNVTGKKFVIDGNISKVLKKEKEFKCKLNPRLKNLKNLYTRHAKQVWECLFGKLPLGECP